MGMPASFSLHTPKMKLALSTLLMFAQAYSQVHLGWTGSNMKTLHFGRVPPLAAGEAFDRRQWLKSAMPSREDRCQKIGDPKETKAITAVCSLFTTTSSRPVVYPTQGPMPAPLKRLEFTVLTNGTGVVTFHHLAAGKVLYSLWLQKSKTTIFNSSGSSDEVAEGIYSGDGHFWVAIADEIQVGRGGSDATLVRLQREMPALSVQRLYFRSVPFSAEWKIHTPY